MGWTAETPPDAVRIGPLGWALVALRALPMLAVTFGGLVLLLMLRLVERPLFGAHRPWTPWITQAVCRADLAIIGLRREVRGVPMTRGGAVVANHSSWLDIFALNAVQRIYFVSKAEVARWPGIGWLARATGTVFIQRDRREAAAHRDLFRQRLSDGHQLLFFPEGTSTDGLRVLPFKTTLFDAFMDQAEMRIQPVSVSWHAPAGAPPRFYGWWGDMSFGSHLAKVLAAPRQGRLVMTYHPPVRVGDFADRKALARALQAAVTSGHELIAA